MTNVTYLDDVPMWLLVLPLWTVIGIVAIAFFLYKMGEMNKRQLRDILTLLMIGLTMIYLVLIFGEGTPGSPA